MLNWIKEALLTTKQSNDVLNPPKEKPTFDFLKHVSLAKVHPIFQDDPVFRTIRGGAIGTGAGYALAPKGRGQEGAGYGALQGLTMGAGASAGLGLGRSFRDAAGLENKELTTGKVLTDLGTGTAGMLAGYAASNKVFGRPDWLKPKPMKKKANSPYETAKSLYAMKQLGLSRLISHEVKLPPFQAAVVDKTKKKLGLVPSVVMAEGLKSHDSAASYQNKRDDDMINQLANMREGIGSKYASLISIGNPLPTVATEPDESDVSELKSDLDAQDIEIQRLKKEHERRMQLLGNPSITPTLSTIKSSGLFSDLTSDQEEPLKGILDKPEESPVTTMMRTPTRSAKASRRRKKANFLADIIKASAIDNDMGSPFLDPNATGEGQKKKINVTNTTYGPAATKDLINKEAEEKEEGPYLNPVSFGEKKTKYKLEPAPLYGHEAMTEPLFKKIAAITEISKFCGGFILNCVENGHRGEILSNMIIKSAEDVSVKGEWEKIFEKMAGIWGELRKDLGHMFGRGGGKGLTAAERAAAEQAKMMKLIPPKATPFSDNPLKIVRDGQGGIHGYHNQLTGEFSKVAPKGYVPHDEPFVPPQFKTPPGATPHVEPTPIPQPHVEPTPTAPVPEAAAGAVKPPVDSTWFNSSTHNQGRFGNFNLVKAMRNHPFGTVGAGGMLGLTGLGVNQAIKGDPKPEIPPEQLAVQNEKQLQDDMYKAIYEYHKNPDDAAFDTAWGKHQEHYPEFEGATNLYGYGLKDAAKRDPVEAMKLYHQQVNNYYKLKDDAGPLPGAFEEFRNKEEANRAATGTKSWRAIRTLPNGSTQVDADVQEPTPVVDNKLVGNKPDAPVTPGILNRATGLHSPTKLWDSLSDNHKMMTGLGGAAALAGIGGSLADVGEKKKRMGIWGPLLGIGGLAAAAHGVTGGQPSRLLDKSFWKTSSVADLFKKKVNLIKLAVNPFPLQAPNISLASPVETPTPVPDSPFKPIVDAAKDPTQLNNVLDKAKNLFKDTNGAAPVGDAADKIKRIFNQSGAADKMQMLDQHLNPNKAPIKPPDKLQLPPDTKSVTPPATPGPSPTDPKTNPPTANPVTKPSTLPAWNQVKPNPEQLTQAANKFGITDIGRKLTNDESYKLAMKSIENNPQAQAEMKSNPNFFETMFSRFKGLETWQQVMIAAGLLAGIGAVAGGGGEKDKTGMNWWGPLLGLGLIGAGAGLIPGFGRGSMLRDKAAPPAPINPANNTNFTPQQRSQEEIVHAEQAKAALISGQASPREDWVGANGKLAKMNNEDFTKYIHDMPPQQQAEMNKMRAEAMHSVAVNQYENDDNIIKSGDRSKAKDLSQMGVYRYGTTELPKMQQEVYQDPGKYKNLGWPAISSTFRNALAGDPGSIDQIIDNHEHKQDELNLRGDTVTRQKLYNGLAPTLDLLDDMHSRRVRGEPVSDSEIQQLQQKAIDAHKYGARSAQAEMFKAHGIDPNDPQARAKFDQVYLPPTVSFGGQPQQPPTTQPPVAPTVPEVLTTPPRGAAEQPVPVNSQPADEEHPAHPGPPPKPPLTSPVPQKPNVPTTSNQTPQQATQNVAQATTPVTSFAMPQISQILESYSDGHTADNDPIKIPEIKRTLTDPELNPERAAKLIEGLSPKARTGLAQALFNETYGVAARKEDGKDYSQFNQFGNTSNQEVAQARRNAGLIFDKLTESHSNTDSSNPNIADPNAVDYYSSQMQGKHFSEDKIAPGTGRGSYNQHAFNDSKQIRDLFTKGQGAIQAAVVANPALAPLIDKALNQVIEGEFSDITKPETQYYIKLREMLRGGPVAVKPSVNSIGYFRQKMLSDPGKPSDIGADAATGSISTLPKSLADRINPSLFPKEPQLGDVSGKYMHPDIRAALDNLNSGSSKLQTGTTVPYGIDDYKNEMNRLRNSGYTSSGIPYTAKAWNEHRKENPNFEHDLWHTNGLADNAKTITDKLMAGQSVTPEEREFLTRHDVIAHSLNGMAGKTIARPYVYSGEDRDPKTQGYMPIIQRGDQVLPYRHGNMIGDPHPEDIKRLGMSIAAHPEYYNKPAEYDGVTDESIKSLADTGRTKQLQEMVQKTIPNNPQLQEKIMTYLLKGLMPSAYNPTDGYSGRPQPAPLNQLK